MIEAMDIWKSYGGQFVLKGVTLSVSRGITAIVGPNGSGKTTLLKILALLEKPTRGRLVVFGEEDWRRAVRFRGDVTMVFQEPVVFRGTVRWNLELCNRGVDPIEVARALRIEHLLNEKAHRLSAGQKKLVSIARALTCNPKVLLLDEPTAYLDPNNAELVINLVAEVSRNMAVVYVTHYYPELERLNCVKYELRSGFLRRLSSEQLYG